MYCKILGSILYCATVLFLLQINCARRMISSHFTVYSKIHRFVHELVDVGGLVLSRHKFNQGISKLVLLNSQRDDYQGTTFLNVLDTSHLLVVCSF